MPLVDRFDDVHGQHIARRLAREFVGAVRGADRDGKRIDLRRGNKFRRLIRIGQKLVSFESTPSKPWPSSLSPMPGFKAAEAPEFAFDRNANPVSHLAHVRGDADVVIVIGGRRAVGLQRAVHHHAVKPIRIALAQVASLLP